MFKNTTFINQSDFRDGAEREGNHLDSSSVRLISSYLGGPAGSEIGAAFALGTTLDGLDDGPHARLNRALSRFRERGSESRGGAVVVLRLADRR